MSIELKSVAISGTKRNYIFGNSRLATRSRQRRVKAGISIKFGENEKNNYGSRSTTTNGYNELFSWKKFRRNLLKK